LDFRIYLLYSQRRIDLYLCPDILIVNLFNHESMKKKNLCSFYLRLLSCLMLTFAAMTTVNAQNITVSGTVTDMTGEAVIGANIIVDGTTIGTISDVNGSFSLPNISRSASLRISYVGYVTQVIALSKATMPLKVMLREDADMLDEVVVVGYGTQKKRDLTGSIVSVKSEELLATAPTTIQEALRGKAAGVVVTGGGLNADPVIRIRGNRSISASNDPLYVIDGVPSSNGVSVVNPSDIESVEVLKDASATAIYGARGANGVILVTTKKGESGQTTVEYTGYLKMDKLDRYSRAQNGAEYAEWLREADRTYLYDGNGGYSIDPSSTYTTMTPNWTDDLKLEYMASRDLSGYSLESVRRAYNANGSYEPSKVRWFDWQSAGMRDMAVSQNHNISIRGGNQNTRIFVSGSFMNNQGITNESFRKRYTLRLNIDKDLSKYLTIGATSNFAYWEYFNGIGVGSNWNPLSTPYLTPGGEPEYGVGGDVTQDGDPALGLVMHPGGEGMLYNDFYNYWGGRKAITKRNQLDMTLYANITLPFGLSYRANFGTSYYSGQDQGFWASASTEQKMGNATANQNLAFNRGWTMEHILGYAKTFGDHSINVTAVQSMEKSINEPVTATGEGMPLESQLWYSLGTTTMQSITSDYTQWTMMSWMGRAIYGFKDNRYMLTASLRYDGSSRLAEGHKWVAFPSASVAWRISDESFMKNLEWISNLKLRVGYGKTGNSSVSPYSTVGQIGSSRYVFGQVGFVGYAPSSLSNSTLTWETTGQYNIGIDYGFLRGRISGSIDFYQQNTYDLLMPRVLPQVSGFGRITQNIGKTKNQGLEVTVQTVNYDTRNFKWSTTLQFATNKEQIVSLASGLTEDIGNSWFVGYPIHTYYNYVDNGVWGYSKQEMEEMAKFNANGENYIPGDFRFADLNGDYKINDDDRIIRGQKMPKWTAGMGNTLRYKDFDLYVFTYGMFGHTIYADPGVGHDGRQNTRAVDYWMPENTDSRYRKPTKGAADLPHREAFWFQKGDFVRISDITLGYTIPRNLTEKLFVKRARFYVQLQNPFLFTGYTNNDPEAPISAGGVGANGAGTTYKNYIVGINLTF
jgi:TonB-linked SusC/RagA family outer membrane protein